MAGVLSPMAVTRPEVVEAKALMSMIDEWMDVIIRRSVAKSGAALDALGCSPARSRAMRSMESVQMADISMLDDWVMVGEEAAGVADEVAAADEIEAAAAAVAAAAAASAAAR
ncbi:hypothetical protein CBR_g26438 [Chara braunii]|uniref:Uncharacterized protein n=1 Tax=Chara braunii TaxID=69332 RepID=A0A388L7X6_CHABU|nr:hypothetical protein CBR_g26438 [Chara braunii]|eukprot:GBG78410.1 hypothetical protein CBR_g26438 [Chara braunii]